MRVLWFVNTPSNASALLGIKSTGGGWIESLENNLKNNSNVELFVAFNYNCKKIKKLKEQKVTYFLIPVGNKNKILKIVNKQFAFLDNTKSIKKYLQVIEFVKPDLIHVFGTEHDFGLITSYTDTPVLLHIQGLLSACIEKWFPQGYTQKKIFFNSSLYSIFTASSYFHQYRIMKKAAEREQKIFSNLKYISGRTAWDKEKSKKYAPQSTYFHCDEILRECFYKTQWLNPINKGNCKIITTIHGNIFKGLEIIHKTSLLLDAKKIKYSWGIAGMYKSDELVSLIEKIEGASFSENITFLGNLKEHELINQLTASNIFIHPSHIDNSPNSVCEAMMIGMPVIAFDVGGVSSIIKDKYDGILLHDGDVNSLSDTIELFISNEDSPVLYGENARKRSLERHDAEHISREVFNIYSKIIADSKGKINAQVTLTKRIRE